MKKIIALFFLSYILGVNAQVTEIYVPNTYDVGGYAGATVPFYQKDGFIYCISHNTATSTNGKIFKINQMTNAVTEIQENNPYYFNSSLGDLPFYNGEYNDKVFFSVWQSYVNLLNTSNNTFTTQYFQYGELNKVFQNYLIEGSYKKNIDTDIESNIGNVNAEYNNQPTSLNVVETSAISNSSFYATHKEYLPFLGNLGTNKIFKFTNSSSLNYSLEYIAPNNHTIKGIFNANNTYELYQIGNKLIFSETIYPCCPYNSVLKSMDVNNNQVSTLLSATDAPSYIKSFVFNNELYFYLNSDTSFIKKTNGTNVVNTNLSDAPNYYLSTSWYMPHRNFIEYQGNIYSLKANGSSPIFFKYDGANIINLSSVIGHIERAIIHNNIMYFYGDYTTNNGVSFTQGVFSFDGNSIRKLDIGTINPEPCLLSSLYGYNNFLFFGNGQSLVKIDLSTIGSTVIANNLSVAEIQNEKSNIIIYPNPIKNFIVIENKKDSTENLKYKVIDLTGRIIKKGNSKFKEQINIESLTNGNYIIQIETEDGEKFTQKLIKN